MQEHTRKVLRQLRKQLPAPFPVRVRLRQNRKFAGGCQQVVLRSGPLFRVTIATGMTMMEEWWSLVHEWAHAIAWTTEHPNLDDHGPLWGVAYAMVYKCASEVE